MLLLAYLPVMSVAGNIFLVGPMGAGKSTIGRQLARLLKKEFKDADHEIEKRTGASIALIFEIEGEEGFRRREAAIVDELTNAKNVVLATGGGVVLDPVNLQLLRNRGQVVYLHAPLDVLVKRTRRDGNRPLLQTTDRRQRLEEIMKQREPLYLQEARIVINTDNRSPQAIAREIVTKLQCEDKHENSRS